MRNVNATFDIPITCVQERSSIAFTANCKRQAEISRLPKTREIYLVSAMEQVLKTEK